MSLAKQTRNHLLGVILFLYLASLALPAYSKCGDQTLPGWSVLLMGWTGLINFDPRWITNFLFLFLILQFLKNRKGGSVIIPYSTILLSASCLVIRPGPCQISGTLGLGGYIWVLSMISMSLLYLYNNMLHMKPSG